MRRKIFRIAHRAILQPYHRQVRGLTLGTRTLVIDGQQRVLLVKHTYSPGWFLPGGGVERGETIYQSAARELLEEAGISVAEQPVLRGICLNDERFPGDHVAVLEVRKYSQLPWQPSLEISAAEFFAPSDLPSDTTEGTRRRIDEVLNNKVIAPNW